jgi:RNA polymerase sigma-70 factor, ECF subfamily
VAPRFFSVCFSVLGAHGQRSEGFGSTRGEETPKPGAERVNKQKAKVKPSARIGAPWHAIEAADPVWRLAGQGRGATSGATAGLTQGEDAKMPDGSAAHVWPGGAVPAPWTVRVVDPEVEDAPSASAYASLGDAELVAACLAGRREAFDIIVERHRRSVYHVCYRFVGNHEDASDLSQEAFVRAWRGLKNFKGQAALSTWLYRIAVNVSLNRVSAKRPEVEPLEADRFVDHAAEDPRAGLMRGERAVAVRRAIAALPDKQRATLILRTYHELSHQEIADILGSSVGAVKANFFHALANLKKILGREP